MLQFFAGSTLAASDLQDMLDLFQKSYAKAGDMSRASTTTMTIDPELQGIPLDVGTYSIQFRGLWTVGAGTAPGLKTQWRFTGTWVSFTRNASGAGQGGTTSPTVTTTMNISGA